MNFHDAFYIGLGVFTGQLVGLLIVEILKGTVGAFYDLYKAHKGGKQ